MQIVGFVNASEILRSGVYLLVHRGVVIYIGKSKCMLGRVYSHRNLWNSKRRRKELPWWVESMLPGIQFDEIHVRPCSLEALDDLERDMIELYKPRYNVQMKTNAKSRAEVSIKINGIPVMLNAKPKVLELARRV